MTPTENKVVDAILHAVPLDVDRNDITPQTSFEALEITSMEVINIVFELEERFAIHIEIEAVFALETLAEVARLVDDKTAAVQA